MVRRAEGATDDEIAHELQRSVHAIEHRRRMHAVPSGPAVSSKEVMRQTLLTSKQLGSIAKDLNIRKPGRKLRGLSNAQMVIVSEQAKTLYPEIGL
jgi:glycerol-3-phosphate O-acyltransferase